MVAPRGNSRSEVAPPFVEWMSRCKCVADGYGALRAKLEFSFRNGGTSDIPGIFSADRPRNSVQIKSGCRVALDRVRVGSSCSVQFDGS